MFSSTCMGSGHRWCSSIDGGTAVSMSNSECSGGTNASLCEMPRADSPMQWSMALCTSDLTLALCSADRSPLDQLHTTRTAYRVRHQRGVDSAEWTHTHTHLSTCVAQSQHRNGLLLCALPAPTCCDRPSPHAPMNFR